MSRWPKKKLSDVATVIRGVTFDKSQVQDSAQPGHIPILRAGNIQKSLIINSDLVYVPDNLVGEEQKLRIGDIAICMSSGSPQIVGKTATLESDWVGSVGAFCAIIRFNARFSHRFGFHWFQSPDYFQWRNQNSKGANIQNLRRTELETLSIPCPEYSEQERIVKILDEADALRKLRAESDARTAALIPALFHEMFGDPNTNPHKYSAGLLKEITVPTQQTDPTKKPDTPFLYIDIASVDNKGKAILNPSKILGRDAPSRARKLVAKDDVIVSMVRPNLNAVALIPPALDGQVCSTGFSVLRPSADMMSEYLFSFTQSKYFIDYLTNKTVGANYPAVGDSDIKSTPILIPPLPIQKEFADRSREARELISAQRASHNQLEGLFQSLLHRAFNGEL